MSELRPAPSIQTFLALLTLFSPLTARADNWDGFPTMILALILVPATAFSVFFVCLAFIRALPTAAYIFATALFLPILWHGSLFFSGKAALALEKPSLPYYAAIALFAISILAYCIIAFRYWQRYFSIGSKSD